MDAALSSSSRATQAKPSASAPVRLGRKALRLVVAGLPNSGKSRLGQALVEAAEGQRTAIALTEMQANLVDLRQQLAQKDVFRADALLLVVDAADAAGDLDETLVAFARSLSFVEQIRGNRAAAGGWPVFLVLARCDLLARPDQSRAAWRQALEQLRKRAEEHFHQVLPQPQPGGLLPFGRIDLRIRAVAVESPPLAAGEVRPGQGLGITELVEQLRAAADAYRKRRARSRRRLLAITAATLLVLAGMVSLAGFLFTQRRFEDPAVRDLLAKVESYRAREPLTASSRLREPLQPRIGELADLEHDADFARLPADKQDYVRQRRRELEEYRAYEEGLQQLPPVASVRNQQELDALERRVKELALPPDHRRDWAQTDAAVLQGQYLEDLRGLRAAAGELAQWFRNLHETGEGLANLSSIGDNLASWSNWRNELGSLLDQAGRPSHRERDLLPGSRLTYETVYHFAEVSQTRSTWEELQRQLEHLNHLSLALGLGVPEAARAPLALPADFSADQAVSHLAELEQQYPHYQEEFRPGALPPNALSRMRKEVRKSYDRAVAAGRAVVLRHWREAAPYGGDTLASWQRLLPWLTGNPAELKAWRGLATLLAHLLHSAAEDPAAALAAFLREEQFELDFNRLYLEMPDGLNLRPAGALVIQRQSGGIVTPLASFELLADADRDAGAHLTRYTFRPSSAVRLTYRPGEALTANLPVQVSGSADYVLGWSRSRTQTYQFESLIRPPLLHRKDQPGAQGQVLEGVRLVISPEDGLPRVPDLLPEMPAK